jgi:programmed cell death protein 5
MEDDELERIRQRRLAEMQQQDARSAGEQEAQRRMQEQQEAQKEALLRAILSPEARERLTRVRIARPDQAEVLERQLILLAQSGRIQHQLNDEEVKAILAKLFPPKRDISIRRKGSLD